MTPLEKLALAYVEAKELEIKAEIAYHEYIKVKQLDYYELNRLAKVNYLRLSESLEAYKLLSDYAKKWNYLSIYQEEAYHERRLDRIIDEECR